MSRFGWRRIVGTTILLMPLIFVGYLLFPVKFALKQKDLDSLKKPYFLIEFTQVTSSSWKIVGDQNGYYEHGAYIIDDYEVQHIKSMIDDGKYTAEIIKQMDKDIKDIIGNGEMPSVVQSDVFTMWHSTYVGYVNYVGERDIGIDITISEYEFTGWDILYPVKRDGIIPFLPKSYICKWDLIDERILLNYIRKKINPNY